MADNLKLVGLSLGEVADALGDDYSFRVVERDGVMCAAAGGYVEGRVNLRLADRKVVSYTVG